MPDDTAAIREFLESSKGESEIEEGGGEEDRRLVRLLIGGRIRRQRLRRLLLADILRNRMEERSEEGETEDEDRGTDEERNLVRMLIGASMVRRRRLRRLLLAHLLRERFEERGSEEGEEGEEREESGSTEEHRLARMLVGAGIVRRRRLRRLLLAHLLRDRFEETGEAAHDEAGEGSESDTGSDEDRRLVRMLIGRGVVRRSRLRRLLMAQLLRTREEAGAHEYA